MELQTNNKYQEGVKYPKSELKNICTWAVEHIEYDVNEREDYVEIALRPNWEEERKTHIRLERKRVCFPVVNRGELWYARLTDEQNEELQAWYQAWLDAPETGVKPETPAWV